MQWSKTGSKKLIKTLDSRYEVPGRKCFSQKVFYEACRRKLEIHLRNYATSTDTWSNRTSEPYISLTIHYINEEWAFQIICLQMSYFPEDHTSEILCCQRLEDALAPWSLSKDQQVRITTDNAANIVKAVLLKNVTKLLLCQPTAYTESHTSYDNYRRLNG